jgi:5-methylcytosine-specific restriction endonuclease McrBC GTP-binding regulatory subunit McrB
MTEYNPGLVLEFVKQANRIHAENGRLRDALHDAICRPMGTCPDSAVEFIEETRMAAALARRPVIYGEVKQ